MLGILALRSFLGRHNVIMGGLDMEFNRNLHQVFVSHKEASELIPIFMEKRMELKGRLLRQASHMLIEELELVRGDVDYSPMNGRQIFLLTSPFRMLSPELQSIRAKAAKLVKDQR